MKKLLLFLIIIFAAYFIADGMPMMPAKNTYKLSELARQPVVEHRFTFMADDFSVFFGGLLPWKNPQRTITIAAATDFPFRGRFTVDIHDFFDENLLIDKLGEDYPTKLGLEAMPANIIRETVIWLEPLGQADKKQIRKSGSQAIKLRINFNRNSILQGQLTPGSSYVTRLDVCLGVVKFPLWLKVVFPERSWITFLLPAVAALFALHSLFLWLTWKSKKKKYASIALPGDLLEITPPKQESPPWTAAHSGRLLEPGGTVLQENFAPNFSLAETPEGLQLIDGINPAAGPDRHPANARHPEERLAENNGTITLPYVFVNLHGDHYQALWKLQKWIPGKSARFYCHATSSHKAGNYPGNRFDLNKHYRKTVRSLIFWSGMLLYAVIYLLNIQHIF